MLFSERASTHHGCVACIFLIPASMMESSSDTIAMDSSSDSMEELFDFLHRDMREFNENWNKVISQFFMSLRTSCNGGYSRRNLNIN